MNTNSSQVALLSLLVLSTSSWGIGCYITSSTVALYPDCLTSPSLFPSLHLLAAVALIFSPFFSFSFPFPSPPPPTCLSFLFSPLPLRAESECLDRLGFGRGRCNYRLPCPCIPPHPMESVPKTRQSSLF